MEVGQYQYDEGDFLGAGAYAIVFSAIHGPTKRGVVLKRIQLTDNEVTLAILRECLIQQELKHPNILRMECVLVSGGFLYLVLEQMSFDMREHMTGYKYNYEDLDMIKKFMKSLLSGLAHCHSHNIMHRDIKPENLFISNKELKIGDFGSARGFTAAGHTSDIPTLTPAVVTVDYRAPEILMGATDYSKAVDMWAAGCIFAEMFNLQPIFGRNEDTIDGGSDLTSENEVLGKIFRVLGTPDENTWPGVSQLKFPDDFHFPEEEPVGLEILVPRLDVDPAGKDLLSRLLCLNPEARISAEDALKHAYFAGPETEPES